MHLIWATWRFWRLCGHAEEVARYEERILASADQLPPDERAMALSAAGFTLITGRGPDQGAAAVRDRGTPFVTAGSSAMLHAEPVLHRASGCS